MRSSPSPTYHAGLGGGGAPPVRLHPPDDPAGAGVVRPASGRADQRRLLRDAEPRPGGDLRAAQHHQLRPRRAIHARRILRVVSVEYARPRLLAGISAGAADRRRGGDRYRAPLSAPHLPPRPPLRTAADLWFGADHRGGFPPAIRLLGPALRDPAGAAG